MPKILMANGKNYFGKCQKLLKAVGKVVKRGSRNREKSRISESEDEKRREG